MSNQSSEGILSPFLQNLRIREVKKHLAGQILDIGCGNGALAHFCEPKNYLGFDICAEVIGIAKETHPSYKFTTKFPMGKRFNTIVLLAVIEHINKPFFFLNTIGNLLENNGKIIITTPHPGFGCIHTLGSKIQIFSSEANEEHQELINLEKMAVFIENSNLRIVKYHRFMLFANQLFILEKG